MRNRRFVAAAEALEARLALSDIDGGDTPVIEDPVEADTPAMVVALNLNDGPPQTMGATAPPSQQTTIFDTPTISPSEATFQLMDMLEAEEEAELMLLSEQMPNGMDAFTQEPGPTPIQPYSAY